MPYQSNTHAQWQTEHSRWRTEAELSNSIRRHPAYPWLTSPESLTHRLITWTKGQIQFSLAFAGWGPPTLQEAKQLPEITPIQPCWIRHMAWRYQETDWVHGRVLIPKYSNTSPQLWKQLTCLGAQSLGSQILFPAASRPEMQLAESQPGTKLAETQPAATRARAEPTEIQPKEQLTATRHAFLFKIPSTFGHVEPSEHTPQSEWQRAKSLEQTPLDWQPTPNGWARQSIFIMNDSSQQPLLITEVFTPAFLEAVTTYANANTTLTQQA